MTFERDERDYVLEGDHEGSKRCINVHHVLVLEHHAETSSILSYAISASERLSERARERRTRDLKMSTQGRTGLYGVCMSWKRARGGGLDRAPRLKGGRKSKYVSEYVCTYQSGIAVRDGEKCLRCPEFRREPIPQTE